MKTNYKKEELIHMISSVLEKHRDALSTDEIQSFNKTIEVLQKIEGSDPKEYGETLELITLNVLKFFTKPEILERFSEWFNN